MNALYPMRIAVIILPYLLHTYADAVVSFEEARAKVLQNNPELQVATTRIKASQANIKQALLVENPELEIALENLGQNEIEAAISHTFELGGKRKARTTVARLEQHVARLEYEENKRALEAELIRRYVPILAVQNSIEAIDSATVLAQSTCDAIKKRVQAGAAKSVDLMRAEIEVEELLLERALAEKQLKPLAQALAGLWGDADPDFLSVSGTIHAADSLPSKEDYYAALEKLPSLQLLETEKKIAQAQENEARAGAAPDLTLTGGYIRNNESGENAGLLAAAIPLPLFSRNQGDIAAAQHSLQAADFSYRAALNALKADIAAAHSEAEALAIQIKALHEKIIPKAEEVQETILRFYNQGSVSVLELIEAQAEVLELKTRLIETITEQAMLMADLEELTGVKTTIISN
jgi:cobalt-zinc-cadmium efflux system outer membrane protein